MMGRVDDITGPDNDAMVMYAGFATGGVWKTQDGGAHWRPVFDQQPNQSIGAIGVAATNANIVYVGTGEANNRQSSTIGDGMWGSTDGGEHWTHLGLENTQTIGRIVVDPTNPNVVYVAAVGHLFGPNEERGLYKTTDGGKTWKKIKYIDENTGFTDVAIDPVNPKVLYAASYERRRTWFGFNGAGPGSALWKTTDGGATWKKLEGPGLAQAERRRLRPHGHRHLPRAPIDAVRAGRSGHQRRAEQRHHGRRRPLDRRRQLVDAWRHRDREPARRAAGSERERRVPLR